MVLYTIEYYWMALWGRCKYKDICSTFFIVVFVAAGVYFLIGQLENIKQFSKPKTWTEKVNTSGDASETANVLQSLGFVDEPVLFNPLVTHTYSSPVFAVFVESQQIEELYNFLGSFRLYFSGRKLVVYDLGIPENEYDVIMKTCHCEIRGVAWDKYPPHIQNTVLKAYRPVVIQSTLREFGMVFWCNPSMRFISSDLSSYMSQAHTFGLVSWAQTRFPTSALTHYNTFRYFHANHSDYYFHRFVQPTLALYVNTRNTHTNLMRPWVSCALDIDCIAPVGSQPSGCNFQHRPKYMYVGCHHYDSSAFNVLLGLMFQMETPYMGKEDLFTLGDSS